MTENSDIAVTEHRLMIPRLLSDHGDGALRELASRLENTGRIEAVESFVSAVQAREQLCPTVVGEGVALPHARGAAVRHFSLAAGVAHRGLRWGTDWSTRVHVVFLCAVPLAGVDRYLQLIAGLSRWMRDERTFLQFSEARQPEEMLRLIKPALDSPS